MELTTSRVGSENDPTVTFKQFLDRKVYAVKISGENKTLVEISGYDLKIGFNFEFINSTEDVELAVQGISDMFRHMILEKLLEYQKQDTDENTINIKAEQQKHG